MAQMNKTSSNKANKSEPNAKFRKVPSRAAMSGSSQQKLLAKNQLEELRLENKTLKENVEAETKAKEQLIDTFQSLMCKVLRYVDVNELNTYIMSEGNGAVSNHSPSVSDVDYSKLPSVKVVQLFTVLLEDKFGENNNHMITRLEELETRVTEQSQEIAKQSFINMKLQQGLDDIDCCGNIAEVRAKVEELKLGTMGPHHVNSVKIRSVDELDGSLLCKQPVESYGLRSPHQKLPGETHVRQLDPGIRETLITELSQLKVNGADWRMFALRVGIADETIQKWKKMRLSRPMENILEVWSQSAGATMRMLHRHLASPQLRCRVLAKRLSDFYLVD